VNLSYHSNDNSDVQNDNDGAVAMRKSLWELIWWL